MRVEGGQQAYTHILEGGGVEGRAAIPAIHPSLGICISYGRFFFLSQHGFCVGRPGLFLAWSGLVFPPWQAENPLRGFVVLV